MLGWCAGTIFPLPGLCRHPYTIVLKSWWYLNVVHRSVWADVRSMSQATAAGVQAGVGILSAGATGSDLPMMAAFPGQSVGALTGAGVLSMVAQRVVRSGRVRAIRS